MSIASRITSIEGHISDIYDSVELTGVDTTDIDKSLVNVPNTLKEGYIDIINNGTDTLYNNFPKVSGEGTSLTLNNTYQAPMRNNLKGNTSQTGTPTPTNPTPVNVVSGDNEIDISGSNLFDISTITQNTYINSQGGTGTSSVTNLSDYVSVESNTKYLFSYEYTTLLNTTSRNIVYYDASKEYLTGNAYTATDKSRILTTPNNAKYLRFSYDKNCTNIIVADLDTYNIDLPVENLFDNDLQDNLAHPNCTYSYVNGEIVVSATGSDCYLGEQTSVGQSWSSIKGQLIEVEPNTTYTYSITNPMFAKNFVVFYDSNKVSTKSNYIRQASYTFTTENTTKYISMRIGNENSVSGTTYKLNVMLEKGSKANSYTPYGTTPIELCKIGTYQDYFYKDSDKWYLHKEIGKYTFTGNESITLSQTADVFYINNAYTNALINDVNVPLCTIFSGASPKLNASVMGYTTPNNYTALDSGTNKRFYFHTNVYSTPSDLATGLTGQSIYWIYETPTNTEITDTTLINQLEQFYQAQSKNNQTNISQINNDLGFIISASALKKG